jgi:hypothetical protein
MNNNSKQRRALARKSKAKQETFSIPNKVSGNHGSDYAFRTQTIAIGRATRLSRRPKVGAPKG